MCGLYVSFVAYTVLRVGMSAWKNILKYMFNKKYSENDRKILRITYRILKFPLPNCKRTFCAKTNKRGYIECVKLCTAV